MVEECDDEDVADNSNSVAEAADAFAVSPPDDDEHDDSVCSSELGMDCRRPLGWQQVAEVRHDYCPFCKEVSNLSSCL